MNDNTPVWPQVRVHGSYFRLISLLKPGGGPKKGCLWFWVKIAASFTMALWSNNAIWKLRIFWWNPQCKLFTRLLRKLQKKKVEPLWLKSYSEKHLWKIQNHDFRYWFLPLIQKLDFLTKLTKIKKVKSLAKVFLFFRKLRP